MLSVLGSCGGTTTPPSHGVFRVGLVTAEPFSNGGGNTSITAAAVTAGLQEIEKEPGARVAHVQVPSPSRAEEQLRAWGSAGYSLCIGNGIELEDATARVARKYPRTFFVTISGSRTARNLAPVVIELEQAAYLCGLVSGRMSRSAKAGMVGGKELPSITTAFLAFEAGQKAGNPGAAALPPVYTGSFEDAALSKAATLGLADKGCDFVFQSAGAGALGVFRAATERGIWTFGAGEDQSALSPSVLASAVIDMPRAILDVARRAREGRLEGRALRYGLASGVVSFAWNPAAAGRVPAPVVDEVEATRRKIVSGALAVPRAGP
jgi:basic membrane lipoprotein Med (substrate-binding protein (PBP1-ABC) superfamily)